MVFYGGEIVNRIKQIRKKQKLSQGELAKMAGIDQSDLSKIENDKKSITLDTAKKIARALGYSVEHIWPD
jgi:transcriptional regulator with XRE-family HTH domain